MPVYESSAAPRPEHEFEPGTLRHLVSGARGRLLDPRRTPVSVVEVVPATGFVRLRIEGFEDSGAIWEVPLERAGDFQFERGGPHATDREVADMDTAIKRFAHTQTTDADPADRQRTEERIRVHQAEAASWLMAHSRFLAAGAPLPDPSARRGDKRLIADLEAYLRELGLWDIEEAFTRVFVSNPGSGETVKGHRIALAELGLADYLGSIVRDPATFSGAWTHERRSQHIIARLAFIRALFEALGIREVALWRGLSAEHGLRHRPGRTFVSTSFDEAVARSHYDSGPAGWTHVLKRRSVSVRHIFMTYHETAAMNDVFLEAEAVLLAHSGDRWP